MQQDPAVFPVQWRSRCLTYIWRNSALKACYRWDAGPDGRDVVNRVSRLLMVEKLLPRVSVDKAGSALKSKVLDGCSAP